MVDLKGEFTFKFLVAIPFFYQQGLLNQNKLTKIPGNLRGGHAFLRVAL